jgi:hypothetical protein
VTVVGGFGHSQNRGIQVAQNDVIGWQNQKQRFGVNRKNGKGCGQNRGASIAPNRFADNQTAALDFIQLMPHQIGMAMIGHHDRVVKARPAMALHRGLKIGQAALAVEGLKLFGLVYPRHWPKPGTHAAAQDEGVNHAHFTIFLTLVRTNGGQWK